MRYRLLPFVFFLLCAPVIKAQKISYAEPGGNLDHTQYNIIGSIKNHIIVWEYFHSDYSTSQILVYDNDLKLLNKVKVDPVKSRFSLLDFINEKDSFDVIYQYVSNHTFFCKRLSFDENGNNTRLETLKTHEVAPGILAGKDYSVIQSPNKKNFILLHSGVDKTANKILLSYILFADNKTRFDHSNQLPYYSDSTTSYIFSLDNADHFTVVGGEGPENKKLVLYEINPGTGDVAGIEGMVREGVLNMESLDISNVNDHIFITAYWKNEQPGIFVWQPDLYNFSAGKDTIYTVETDSALARLKHVFLKTQVYPYHNTYNFFITAHSESQYYPVFDRWSSLSSWYYPTSPGEGNFQGSFYDNRPTSVDLNSSKTINGINTSNAYNDRDVNPTLKDVSQQREYTSNFPIEDAAVSYSRLLIYNINENRDLHWYTYLGDTIENEFTSYLNPSYNLHASQLYIFYNQADGNKIQRMGVVTVDDKGEYSVNPIAIMKTSYRYFFNSGKKINENTVMYACNVKNKLAFMKVEFR